MKIEDAQEMMRQIYFERDSERGIPATLLRTFQELAELNDAIIGEQGRNAVSEEVADVFAWLCSLANLLDIDVKKAFFSKYAGVCPKCGGNPCQCRPDPSIDGHKSKGLKAQ
ncbi:MAG: MazG nucleotide pyrophosphohydrolase domain-containing protein [Candidatus Thorarchaeota archaeon]|nr:MAG: nucleotide pyrophosphohydrolase [Candidatus Thorarchaeota archaeon]RLI59694.1 MAG: nucleotide pyrophosphohydrolase [Candidatus Thorarchaeota archaeon]